MYAEPLAQYTRIWFQSIGEQDHHQRERRQEVMHPEIVPDRKEREESKESANDEHSGVESWRRITYVLCGCEPSQGDESLGQSR